MEGGTSWQIFVIFGIKNAEPGKFSGLGAADGVENDGWKKVLAGLPPPGGGGPGGWVPPATRLKPDGIETRQESAHSAGLYFFSANSEVKTSNNKWPVLAILIPLFQDFQHFVLNFFSAPASFAGLQKNYHHSTPGEGIRSLPRT